MVLNYSDFANCDSKAPMGLMRRISSYFKPKSQEKSEKEEKKFQNGSELQAELIAFSNGWYGIPIRSFTAKELAKATNRFAEHVFNLDFGTMYRGHLEGRQVLVNTCPDSIYKYSSNHRHGAIRDIVIAIHMSHLKNVLKLIGCCLEFKYPASVYDCAGGTLLSEYLYSPNSDNKLLFPWRSRLKIATDISSTLVYLHTAFSTPVIYRDIKPSKVIIDQYGVAKLFDFTLCISLPPGESRVEDPIKGTFGFLDPEYYISSYVTQKTDVYSFGVVLLVLLTGKSALWENHEGEKVHVVEYVKHYADNHQYDELIDPRILEEVRGVGNDTLLLSFVDLALMCTQDNGDERPEMIDVAKQLKQMEKSIRNHLPNISS